MKVFLTGGTGYLGRRLAEGLRREGHELVCLSRSLERARGLEDMGAQVVRGDVTCFDEAAVDLSEFDAVVHSAAMVKTKAKDPRDFDRVNVDGAAAVARAAMEAGVPKFLYTSSFMALGASGDDGTPLDESAPRDPQHVHNDYERTKYLGLREIRRLRDEGLPAVILCPCVIFGPGAVTSGNLVGGMIADLLRGRLPGILGDGKQIWTYSYIGDVVEGHLLALERAEAGSEYILGGESLSMEEFVRQAAELAGVRAPERHIPFSLAKVAALAEEVRCAFTGREPGLTRGVVEIYRHNWHYTSRRAEQELGYKITPFRSALAETVSWVKGAIEEGKFD